MFRNGKPISLETLIEEDIQGDDIVSVEEEIENREAVAELYAALDELGARYSSVGENIAYVSNIYKPGRIVENWLNSPGHCANMMSDANIKRS